MGYGLRMLAESLGLKGVKQNNMKVKVEAYKIGSPCLGGNDHFILESKT